MTTKTTQTGTQIMKLTKIAKAMKANGLLNSKNELMLYGVIGDWWEGMDALTIVRELEAISGDTMRVRIHSPGGNIAEGLAMYNQLSQSDKRVEIHIDGVCASMATVVAQAGDVIFTPDNALWMVHKPWNEAAGNSDELRQAADNLDVFEASVIAAYTAKGRVTEEQLQEIFSTGKDYLMTGAEAVTQGFADELLPELKAAAQLDITSVSCSAAQRDLLTKFYSAVNAAPKPKQQTNREAPPMKLKQLLAQKAALTDKGVAANQIVSALALAFGVDEKDVDAMLAKNSTATEDQLQAGFEALAAIKPVEKDTPLAVVLATGQSTPADANAAIAQERTRVADINALAQTHSLPAKMRDKMIADGTDIDGARGQALDHMAKQDHSAQPRAGVRFTDTTGEAFREGMANAMLNRMQPGQFKLEDGAMEFRGLNLLEMASSCLHRVGQETRGQTKNELAAMAMNTTSDFPNIVADVANKVLLAAYQAQPRTFLPVSKQSTATDFKAKHAIEIGGGSDLKEVNEKGEFEVGSVSESDRSYKVLTFGRIFNFSRQLLVNDSIGAFDQFFSNIGSLAARKESTIVWSLVKTGAVYSAGNKNLAASGTALDEAALDAMRKLFRKMKGLDGEPINITMQHLAVSSDRELEAQKLLSAVLAATTGDVNVFANSFSLIVEPLLDDVTNDPFYGFANPMLAPALEHSYLEGEEAPYIETKAGFEVDGIQIKARHDFGAGWIGHRGSVKHKGTA
jgi:ATP-dependent protease ClpP protease subunit